MFTQWLTKRGHLQSEENVGVSHVVYTIDTNKFVRKDHLLISLRKAFTNKGLQENSVSLATIKIAAPKEPTIAEIVKEMAKTKDELQELRTLVGREAPTTNITNNNLIILNFGSEDMSYLQPSKLYLERAFKGLSELVKDLYFNANQPQNHGIRINVPLCSAEVCTNGEWKKVDLPEATTKMIGKCGNYMLSAYNSDIHKENDAVMEFGCSLHSPGKGKSAFIRDEIHRELMIRARQQAAES